MAEVIGAYDTNKTESLAALRMVTASRIGDKDHLDTTKPRTNTKVETIGNYTYVGIAKIGSASSEAVWQIFRIDTGTIDADITWADSTDAFTKVWDNKATYTY